LAIFRRLEVFAAGKSWLEKADASRYHGKVPDEIDWSVPERQSRAVTEFLSGLADEDPDADRKLPKVIELSLNLGDGRGQAAAA
jgi:hypothetical protein